MKRKKKLPRKELHLLKTQSLNVPRDRDNENNDSDDNMD